MSNVTTVSGKTLPASKCRMISGGYYVIGDNKIKGSGECYQIGDKYYRDTSYITFDHLNEQYVINNESIIHGVVGIDDNGDLLFGNYERIVGLNDRLKIIDQNNKTYSLMSVEAGSNSNFYVEDYGSGKFYHVKKYSVKQAKKVTAPPRSYKNSLVYNTSQAGDQPAKLFEKSKFKIKSIYNKYASYIKGYTFGVEFETSTGFINNRQCVANGLIPLRDGSIDGIEYATVPLEGAKGLQALDNTAKLLHERTKHDDKCSLHFHIGGLRRDEDAILAFYKLTELVENEIFAMFPLYKKHNFGFKRKHYTKPYNPHTTRSLDRIIDRSNLIANFSRLFGDLCVANNYSEYNNSLSNVQNHPLDPGGDRKWQIRSRYFWCNIIPIIFTNKKTVEFRVHTPTTDIIKILNFLFLCIGLTKLSNTHTKAILKGDFNSASLTDIIYRMGFPASLTEELVSYCNARAQYSYSMGSAGKIVYEEDDFKFKSNIWSKHKSVFFNTPNVQYVYRRNIRRNGNDFIGDVASGEMRDRARDEEMMRVMQEIEIAARNQPTIIRSYSASRINDEFPVWFNTSEFAEEEINSDNF